MYEVRKSFEISASHKLELNYSSKCSNLHGHNWHITVTCQSETLNSNGMVYDFSHIKTMIHDILDHRNLNDILPFNPTAENMAKWIADTIGNKCVAVEVQESDGNVAKWSK